MSAAVCACVCVLVRVDGGVNTDVLALSFLYMNISTAVEESLAQSDVTFYSRNHSWSQMWRVKSP